MSELIRENIESIIFFGLFAIATSAFAWSRGFYHLPKKEEGKNDVTLFYVLIVFALFLGAMVGAAPVLTAIFRSIGVYGPKILTTLVQFVTILLALLLIFLFCVSKNYKLFLQLWKTSSTPIWYDLSMGSITWIVAFPLTAAIGQIVDFSLLLAFGEQYYEQIAVQYLKNSLSSPLLLSVAAFTILIVAPVFEEFLFRGVLQNWLKNHMSRWGAILASSALFALFHYSTEQKISNISLTISLFVLGCFLGFIYERQRSLYAAIGLHATFNAISALRIALFPEI